MKIFNLPNSVQYTLMLIIIFSMTSCEKEIEIVTREIQPQLVVEAKISNRPGDVIVILSLSSGFNENGSFPAVSGAEVSITDLGTNITYMLFETSPGRYTDPILAGIENHTYRLEILLSDGSNYSAEDTMPFAVRLDNAVMEEADEIFQDEDEAETSYEVLPQFIDPEAYENFYQIIVKQHDMLQDNIYVISDLGFNGLPNSQKISVDALPGIQMEYDLHTISEPAYRYLLGLEANLSQSAATPTNPVSNISGSALGYFKAFAAEEIIVAMPE